jgi:hypothetical protein
MERVTEERLGRGVGSGMSKWEAFGRRGPYIVENVRC